MAWSRGPGLCSLQGQGLPLPTVLVLQQAGPLRGLEGTYIYTVELFLGTSGFCRLPLSLYCPLWVH